MKIDNTISALADPTRRELLRRLASNPCRATALARGFSISRPAVVKHTRVLKKAGLIRSKKRGREQIYELAPAGQDAIRELIAELEQMSRFWGGALDAFKRYAEAQAR